MAACGGKENLAAVSRFRIVPVDKTKMDQEGIKKVNGVLNLIIKEQEYQIVIGEDAPSVYEEVKSSHACFQV